MDFGLVFCFIALVLTVIFFILARSIAKERRASKLEKEKRGKFYAKVTALVAVGLSVAACSSISAVLLINEFAAAR